MYLPSNTPLLQGQRERAACCNARSQMRIDATRELMARGRAGIFEDIMSPEDLTRQFGIGVGVNAAKHQAQTYASRASGLLGTQPETTDGPSLAQLIADAPIVESLNRHPSQDGCSDVIFAPRLVGPDPTPSMPHGAPKIVNTTLGPMYVKGRPATYPLAQQTGDVFAPPAGLTGYNPPWSDAWVMRSETVNPQKDMGVSGWIKDHPWLSLAIAGAGMFALSQTKRGRR